MNMFSFVHSRASTAISKIYNAMQPEDVLTGSNLIQTDTHVFPGSTMSNRTCQILPDVLRAQAPATVG